MDDKTKEEYKNYLELNGIKDEPEHRASFLLYNNIEDGADMYKDMGRDVSNPMILMCHPSKISIEQFCEEIKSTIDAFGISYKRIEGDAKHWPEHWFKKLEDFYLD